MQATSALHKSIFATFPACDMDYKVTVAGTEYGQDAIEALSTPKELYPAAGNICGQCVCGEIEATIRLAEGAAIPRAAEVKVEIRLVTRDRSGNITQAGETFGREIYIGKGTDPSIWREVSAAEAEEMRVALETRRKAEEAV